MKEINPNRSTSFSWFHIFAVMAAVPGFAVAQAPISPGETNESQSVTGIGEATIPLATTKQYVSVPISFHTAIVTLFFTSEREVFPIGPFRLGDPQILIGSHRENLFRQSSVNEKALHGQEQVTVIVPVTDVLMNPALNDLFHQALSNIPEFKDKKVRLPQMQDVIEVALVWTDPLDGKRQTILSRNQFTRMSGQLIREVQLPISGEALSLLRMASREDLALEVAVEVLCETTAKLIEANAHAVVEEVVKLLQELKSFAGDKGQIHLPTGGTLDSAAALKRLLRSRLIVRLKTRDGHEVPSVLIDSLLSQILKSALSQQQLSSEKLDRLTLIFADYVTCTALFSEITSELDSAKQALERQDIDQFAQQFSNSHKWGFLGLSGTTGHSQSKSELKNRLRREIDEAIRHYNGKRLSLTTMALDLDRAAEGLAVNDLQVVCEKFRVLNTRVAMRSAIVANEDIARLRIKMQRLESELDSVLAKLETMRTAHHAALGDLECERNRIAAAIKAWQPCILNAGRWQGMLEWIAHSKIVWGWVCPDGGCVGWCSRERDAHNVEAEKHRCVVQEANTTIDGLLASATDQVAATLETYQEIGRLRGEINAVHDEIFFLLNR